MADRRNNGLGRYARRLVIEHLEPRLVLDASMLRITEFGASNHDVINDADGDASDWIEIYNSGSDAVSLAGMHLTDDATKLTKWTFPAERVSPAVDIWLYSLRTRTPSSRTASSIRISSSRPTASIWAWSTRTARRSSTNIRRRFRRSSMTSPTVGRCRPLA